MKNKPIILYLITQSELGGAQKYVLDLAGKLKADYKIIIGFGEQGEKGELSASLKKENIDYYSISNLKRKITFFHDFLALLEIISLIKKVKPDIVHLNSSKISILGSIASLFYFNKRKKIVYTAHGWVYKEPLPIFKKYFYKWAEKLTSIFKDRIICVSNADCESAIKEKIAEKNKLFTIHNGIKPREIYEKSKARQKLAGLVGEEKIDQSDFIIGSIGNLYKTKGFNDLIKTAGYLLNNGMKIKIFIIGEGEERKNLERLIKKLNLEDNVILAGRINDAYKYLKAFDIYVSSSVKEGLSYTVIEAMMSGLPIVATKVGGNPELITDKKEGLLAEANNLESLANAILLFINNTNLRINLGSNAKNKAFEEFSLDKMAEKTKAVYEKPLES